MNIRKNATIFLHLNTFISKITRIDLLAGLEGEMFFIR